MYRFLRFHGAPQRLLRRYAASLCETSRSSARSRELTRHSVNSAPVTGFIEGHFVVSPDHRFTARNVMWLPTPIYERVPQFWFLLGLLFIATGLYLGFEFALSFWYIAIGFSCCAYGAGIFLVRLRHRRTPQSVEQSSAPADHGRAQPVHSEPAHAE
jgi:hypothetical protein